MTGGHSLLKPGAALLALLALVVGAPHLLWVLGRDLLPDRWTGMDCAGGRHPVVHRSEDHG